MPLTLYLENDHDNMITLVQATRPYFELHFYLSDMTRVTTQINFAMIIVMLGVCLLLAGIIIPRDYHYDSVLTSREMEEIVTYYANLYFALDISTLIGMGLVVLGGAFVVLFIPCSIVKLIACTDVPGKQHSYIESFSGSGVQVALV